MTYHKPTFKLALSHLNRPLANLYVKVEQQKDLLSQIRRNLPSQLAEHAQHCVMTEQKLLLYTDSAAWATQLRFYNKTILRAIESLTRRKDVFLQIRISEPTDSLPKKPKRTAKIPSPDNIALIRGKVGDMDDPLNRALLKLSTTLGRLSE